jgi:hypothetical protein
MGAFSKLQQTRRDKSAQRIADQKSIGKVGKAHFAFDHLVGVDQAAPQDTGKKAEIGTRGDKASVAATDENIGKAAFGDEAIVAQEQRLAPAARAAASAAS